jgi:hypothetical protein
MGEPLTGEPDAGQPPVRFGGRGNETNRVSLPLSGTGSPVRVSLKLKYHRHEVGGFREEMMVCVRFKLSYQRREVGGLDLG